MKIDVGTRTFSFGGRYCDVAKVELAFSEEGYVYFIQITSKSGEQFRYTDDGITASSSGKLPVGAYVEPTIPGVKK